MKHLLILFLLLGTTQAHAGIFSWLSGNIVCSSPDDRASDGSRCGGRSAYDRPGGAWGSKGSDSKPKKESYDYSGPLSSELDDIFDPETGSYHNLSQEQWRESILKELRKNGLGDPQTKPTQEQWNEPILKDLKLDGLSAPRTKLTPFELKLSEELSKSPWERKIDKLIKELTNETH